LGEESKRLNEVHFKYVTTGLPFVVLKVAQSLDGRVLRQDRSFRRTSRSGVSGLLPLKDQPIDAVLSDVDSRDFHSVATLFGSTGSRQPKLILLGAGKQITSAVKALPENVRCRTIVVNTRRSTSVNRTPKGLTTWAVGKTKEGEVNPVSLLKKAGKEGISSLLVEGGKELSTALLKRNLVDKIWYFISPQILARGEEPLGDLGIRRISQCKIVKNCEFKQSKDGILAVGYLSRVGGRKTAVSP